MFEKKLYLTITRMSVFNQPADLTYYCQDKSFLNYLINKYINNKDVMFMRIVKI